LGSIGILGACRSGWLVARDPHRADGRVLAQLKNNNAPRQPSLPFTIAGADAGGPLALAWSGPCPAADELPGRVGRPANKPRELDRAWDFLTTFLEHGPRTTREIWKESRKERLSEITLRRAKRELDIRVQRAWAEGRRLSYW